MNSVKGLVFGNRNPLVISADKTGYKKLLARYDGVPMEC